MNKSYRSLIPLLLLGGWLSACYGLRFALMENPHWVEICDGKTVNAICSIRAGLGVTIHFQVLARIALLLAIPAFFVTGKNGRGAAWIALIFAAPALALYTVTLAVFAALIAALRLVRTERHSAPASNNEATAHASA